MVYGLWQSVGGLQAQDYRQSVAANNLANADTPGFKVDRVTFQERLNASLARVAPSTRHPVLDGMTGGVFEAPLYTDFSQGALVRSESPLDVAVVGDGFLAVRTPDGIRYTRDGRLAVDRDGVLRHAASGGEVADRNGRPIVLDPARREGVRIDALGNVRQGEINAGRIALTDFADRSALTKTGAGLFDAGSLRTIEATGRVEQGYYEASGVDPIAALVEMLAASRAYQINATMISLQDESLGRAVTELGRIG